MQEVDVDKLKEMVHVKDEDIAKLDQYVVDQKESAEMRKEVWFGLSIMAVGRHHGVRADAARHRR